MLGGDEEGYMLYILYLTLHCHHQNDCIKMVCGECHFNVSLIVRGKVTKTVHKP